MSREAGKGSSPRPFSVSGEEFGNNWDRVFGKKMKAAYKSKPVRLVNPLNKEEWLCEDYNKVEFIDGIEYVRVKKYDSERTFLMRKDALRKV